MIENKKTGVVIARLAEKQLRKTKEGKSYYLLKLNLRKNLTEMYFKLTGKAEPTLKSNQEPLYLFCDQNQWGHKLEVGNDYFFEYTYHGNYLHLQEWKILGTDKKIVARAWRLLLIKEEEERKK